MIYRENILISACLLGLYCRYDGKIKRLNTVDELIDKYNLIPLCPEIMGGLGTPRNPAEISGDKVINNLGQDVTAYFDRGAKEALKLARLFNCKYAILKERSPSCGYGKIYDGTFSATLTVGNGKTAELLLANGIRVLGETEIERLLIP
mgnify:CR=1 FL=1